MLQATRMAPTLLLRVTAIGLLSGARLAALKACTTSAATALARIQIRPFATKSRTIRARATNDQLHISKAPGAKPGAFSFRDADPGRTLVLRAAAPSIRW